MSVTLEVTQDGLTGGLQLAIGDEKGGFRLAGPKFNGSSRRRLVCDLEDDERALGEVQGYIDKARKNLGQLTDREKADIYAAWIVRELQKEQPGRDGITVDELPAFLAGYEVAETFSASSMRSELWHRMEDLDKQRDHEPSADCWCSPRASSQEDRH
jgi:hypothetical protein